MQGLEPSKKAGDPVSILRLMTRDCCVHAVYSSLSRSIESMSLRDKEEPPKAKSPPPPVRASPSSTRKPGKSSLGLPSINSSDWEFEDVALPPGPSRTR